MQQKRCVKNEGYNKRLGGDFRIKDNLGEILNNVSRVVGFTPYRSKTLFTIKY